MINLHFNRLQVEDLISLIMNALRYLIFQYKMEWYQGRFDWECYSSTQYRQRRPGTFSVKAKRLKELTTKQEKLGNVTISLY